jgi:predicted transcriptional regulator of viral defense system
MGIIIKPTIMNISRSRLGPQERIFITSMARNGKRIISYEDALHYWKSAQLVRKALSRLESNGWLRRLERGLYLLIPLEAGPEGQWSEDPLVIATQLVPEGAVAYWSALRYWNMTEQVPQTTFVQATSRRFFSKHEILGVRYQFVVIKKSRFFGILTRMNNGMPVKITDREKTLVDACDRPDLNGGVMQIAQAIKSPDAIDWDKLRSYLERFRSGAVYKRFGYLIEHLDVSIPNKRNILMEWQRNLTEGICWLEPAGEHSGPVKTRWRIRVNVIGLE